MYHQLRAPSIRLAPKYVKIDVKPYGIIFCVIGRQNAVTLCPLASSGSKNNEKRM